MQNYSPADYIPILIQLGLAIGFVTFVITAIQFLGPKRKSKLKDQTFECGIEAEGDARVPFSVKYFLVAILFVLFDVEVIFLYPWAVNFRALGLAGFAEMLLFIAFFLFGFYYILKKGILKWE